MFISRIHYKLTNSYVPVNLKANAKTPKVVYLFVIRSITLFNYFERLRNYGLFIFGIDVFLGQSLYRLLFKSESFKKQKI